MLRMITHVIMNPHMSKKTILITGASSGIGLATAQHFLSNSWQVVLVTRKKTQDLQKLESEVCKILEADLTQDSDIQKIYNGALKHFGSIDVVMNNAGYGLFGPLETTQNEQISEQLHVNVLSLIQLTQAFIPHFRQNGSGTFVNISSIMGKIPFPFLSLYNASKFAVEGFSESVAYELEPLGIQVKIIEPGTIKTRFFSGSLKTSPSENTVYHNYFERILKSIQKKGETGSSPELVANTIWNAVHDGKKFGRYKPDPAAKQLLFLRAITPVPIFRKILPKVL